MSIPNFPEINPELTRERALDMILASIAMEEQALGHIMEAESEKLKYILDTLEASGGAAPDTDKLLCVNQSVSNLLDVVAQNQLLLKGKMDKAVAAMQCGCSGCTGPIGPTGPVGPTGPGGTCSSKCCTVFNCRPDFKLWHTAYSLPWHNIPVQGDCAHVDPLNDAKILLRPNGRFLISFAVNVKGKSYCNSEVAMSLRLNDEQHCYDSFTFKDHIPYSGAASTASLSGIIVDTSKNLGTSFIYLKLISPDPLIVERAMISIIEL